MLEALLRHRRRIVPAACLAVSLLLMTVEARGASVPLAGLLADVLKVPVSAVRAATGLLGRLGPYLSSKRELAARVHELERANRALLARVTALQAALDDAGLAAFVRFMQEEPEGTLWAELIGRDPVDRYRSAVLGSGALQGVEEGMIAVAPGGLVGRVVEVYPRSAVLLFVTDEGCSAAVRGLESGAEGLLRGTGANSCLLTFVDPLSDLREGEVLVTSGLDGVFPKGLQVGRVVSVRAARGGLFLEAVVAPAADLSRLERVALLPPPPGVEP